MLNLNSAIDTLKFDVMSKLAEEEPWTEVYIKFVPIF